MKVVIIPATYNEKENIASLITILEEEVFPKIKNYSMYILVADDNSPDGTADVVRSLMKKYKNLGINSGEKKGLGAAYIRAMTYAIDTLKADIVFEIDADLQHDPHKIPEFLKKIDEGADMVIGTRYSNGGSIPQNWPPQRKLFSIMANLLVRTIFMRFSIHDWTGGYRAIKKEVFLKEKQKVENFNGYIFQISFLHKVAQDGFKVAEVPFHFSDRTLGKSKIAPLGYIIDVLTYVITTRIIELKRFIKFLIVGGTGFLIQLLLQETSVRIGLAGLIGLFLSSFLTNVNIEALRDGVAGGIGAEGAIISNFMFNNFWTFKDTMKIKERSPFIIRLIKFNLASFASIFIQAFSIGFFVHLLGDQTTIFSLVIPTRIAILFPVIIFIVIPLNYLIYNKIIWKTQYLKNETSTKA